jgi:2-oxoglutarate dehydrogenase E2 component (dihydrolipoamide succinyltransferase)
MAHSVEMPALGESVTEGTVTRWLKQEGDTVEVDEPLVEVSTDKVDTEIPSPAAGVLQRIVVSEDETVEVGAEIAVIGDAGEASGTDTAGGSTDTGSGGYSASGDGAASGSAGTDTGWRLPEEAAAEDEPHREPAQQEPALRQAPAAQSSGGSGSSDGSGSSSGSRSAGGSGTPVTMPALGESVTEGTVTRWLKQVGDTVEVDEPLLEVSTDKVDTEIPSPVGGTVLEIIVGEDETVEVGATLATVGDAGSAPAQASQAAQPETQQAPEPEPEPEPEPQPAAEAPSEPEPAQPAQPAEPERRQPAPAAQRQATEVQADESSASSNGETSAPYVTPLVRKLAAEHGVDLSSVQGTGVGGRIRKQDVLAAVEQPEPEPAAPAKAGQPDGAQRTQPGAAASDLRGKTEKMSRMRSVIAKRMVESLQISAQLTTVVEADITRLATLRDRAKGPFEAREGVKLSFLPFFAKATVEALKQHPKVNASIDMEKGEVTYHGTEHLGIAVDTERGLLVPVIHDAGDLNIAGLARRIADLAERTRANKITPDEMSGGTFTISNTGSRGALFDTPIILQPQVGILGTGSVVKRPAVLSSGDGDTIAIRSITYLALSYDHRLVDGADAARFLNTIKQRLTEAAFEADLGL